jgi:hypothetical protein
LQTDADIGNDGGELLVARAIEQRGMITRVKFLDRGHRRIMQKRIGEANGAVTYII